MKHDWPQAACVILNMFVWACACIANLCHYSFAGASECVCVPVCAPYSLSKSHLCPLLFFWIQRWGDVCFNNAQIGSLVLASLSLSCFLSVSHAAPRRAILPGCSHASDLTRLLIVCKGQNKRGTTFQSHPHPWKVVLCAVRVCGRTQSERLREKFSVWKTGTEDRDWKRERN